MDKIVMYIDINFPGYSVHAAIHNTVVRGERPAPQQTSAPAIRHYYILHLR